MEYSFFSGFVNTLINRLATIMGIYLQYKLAFKVQITGTLCIQFDYLRQEHHYANVFAIYLCNSLVNCVCVCLFVVVFFVCLGVF